MAVSALYEETRQQAVLLRESMSHEQMVKNMAVIRAALILFAILSFGMMFTFLMFWWEGVDLDAIAQRAGINTTIVIILGLVFSAAVAVGEYTIYKEPFNDRLIVWAKVGIVALCVLSDVGVNMDREDQRVRNLSEDSPALNAAVAAIEKNASTSMSVGLPAGYQRAIADQQSAMEWVNGKCHAVHKSKGAERIAQCMRVEQGKLDAASASVAALSSAAGMVASAQETARGQAQANLINQVKDLQHDTESNSHPLVKLVAYITSMEFIFSSMMVSLFVMIPPQLLFMAVGRQSMRYSMAMGGQFPSFSANDLRVDTQQHAASTQMGEATETQTAALNTVWASIDKGDITRISKRDDGQIHQLLKERGFGSTNEARRGLTYFVIESLSREGVIMKNPAWREDKPSGNAPEYVINPNRTIKYKT